MATGYQNLRKHLTSKHAAAYDRTIVEKNWNYHLSSDVKSSKSVEASKHSLPPFTQPLFIDYIIPFVIADDQVTNALSISNFCPHPYLVNSCDHMPRLLS